MKENMKMEKSKIKIFCECGREIRLIETTFLDREKVVIEVTACKNCIRNGRLYEKVIVGI